MAWASTVRVSRIAPMAVIKPTSLSRSFFDEKLILQCPTVIHEVMHEVFRRSGNIPAGMTYGASSDIPLENGDSKTPDFSLCYAGESTNPRDVVLNMLHPTVVFEVAYSQSIQHVSECAGRIISRSSGNVRLVVVVDLPYRKPHDRGPLSSVKAHYWELETGEPMIGEYSGEVGKLLPLSHDGAGVPMQFLYVKKRKSGKLIKLTVSRTETHIVRPIFVLFVCTEVAHFL